MMGSQIYHLVKPFLLMALSLFLVTSCYQPVTQRTHLSVKPAVECRVIQHKFGETCVPLKPQRIIALDPWTTLDPLITLGIKPIGFGTYGSNVKEMADYYGASLDVIKEAINVGDAFSPSLEKILLLKPDLILATEDNQYNLLSAIAPTVVVPSPNYEGLVSKPYFQENLRYVAKIVGEEAQAEEVLSRYQNRIEELKKRLGKQLKQVEISVILYGENIWSIIKNIHPASTILTDVGLRYKLARPGATRLRISIETINEYDSDILFIVDITERGSSFYFKNPLLSSLKAFKNNRVYIVDRDKWYVLGISGANKTLDDLFKYLPKDG
jgi:iron complex transport system substrate-binding protein